MKIAGRIAFLHRGFIGEILFAQVVRIFLFAENNELRLCKIRISVLKNGRKPRLFRLVGVSAGMRAAESKRAAVFFRKKRKRVFPVFFGKIICVSLRTDEDERNGIVLQHSRAAPACGHGVVIALFARRDKHPVVAYKRKNVFF